VFDRSVRRLLVVAGAALMLSLAVPGAAAAVEYTRGFEVRNDSNVKLTFTKVEQFNSPGSIYTPPPFQHGIAGPSMGTSIPPGAKQRFEVTFQFFDVNAGTLIYDIGNTGEQLRVGLLVKPFEGQTYSTCVRPPRFRCTADEKTLSENILTFGK
jgi:hypothetical protein